MSEAPDDPELFELGELLRKAHAAGDARSAKVIVAEMDRRENPQWSDMNIPQSIFDTGVKGGEAIVQMVTHPIDTVTGMAKGAYDLATDPDTRAGLVHDIKKAVGSPAALKKTIIKDPAGSALVAAGIAAPVVFAGRGALRATSRAMQDSAHNSGLTAWPKISAIPESLGIAPFGTKKPALTAPTSGVIPEGAPDQIQMPSRAAQVADDKLYQAMIDSGWTPERIAAKLRQMGPGATLADLEPFWGLGKTSAQTVKGEVAARRSLGERDLGRRGRIFGAIDEALTPENYFEKQRVLREERRATAQPLRREALDENRIVKSDMIQRLLKRPKFRMGLSKGIELAKDQEARLGIEIPKEDTWFSGLNFDDPNIELVHTPTLRMLDAAKQGLDVQLEKYRNKTTGQLDLDPEGVELKEMRDDVTKVLRSHSQKYADYLDAWSEPTGELKALSYGRKILNGDPEIGIDNIRGVKQKDGTFKGGMTDGEKEALRVGLARDMKDDILDNPTTAIKHFKDPRTREIMQAAFSDKKSYNIFRKRMLIEARKHETASRARVGSPTARNAVAMADAETPETLTKDMIGSAFDIATGNKVGFMRRWAERARNKIMGPKPDDSVTPVLDQTGDVIYSQDPATQQRMVTRFKNRFYNRSPAAADDFSDADRHLRQRLGNRYRGRGPGIVDPEDNY